LSDTYFTIKTSNLIDRFLYYIVGFIDNLAVAYFLEHPVYLQQLLCKAQHLTVRPETATAATAAVVLRRLQQNQQATSRSER